MHMNFSRLKFCSIVALVALCSLTASAAISGAIYTTLPVKSDGTTPTITLADVGGFIVNANTQYPGKTFVFLNGGPQNIHSSGLDAGTYYFQVTAPPGSGGGQDVLLSADPANCRLITVGADGFIDGLASNPGATGTISQANCPDRLVFHDLLNGGFPVQVCPAASPARADDTPLNNGSNFTADNWCDTTSNGGGEYKVWLVKQSAAAVDSDGVHLIIDSGNQKTDTFKIQDTGCSPNCPKTPVVWPIAGYKFFDKDHNGVQASTGEPGINGWRIKIYGNSDGASPVFADGFNSPTVPCSIHPTPDYVSCDASSNSAVVQTFPANTAFTNELGNQVLAPYDGYFRFDDLAAGGTYGVCELVPASSNPSFAWTKTPACPTTYNPFETVNLTSPYVDAVTTLPVPNEYNLAYPATVTRDLRFPGDSHLGRGDAVCSDPAPGHNLDGFYTNIDDIFESGGAGTYDINAAFFPNVANWDGAYPGAVFGNYCKNTPSGGLTLGFWSNNNGAANLTAASPSGVAYVNQLKDPSGTGLRFVGPAGLLAQATTTWFTTLQCSTNSTKNLHCFSYWLTSGSSANAANQLSIQMTAARLNELRNGQSLGDTVYAPGTNCADSSGYATVSCLINEANQAIGLNAYTPSGSAATCAAGGTLGTVNCRTWEVAIQTALNLANNNIGVDPSTLGGAIAECGLNYTGNESCSIPFIARPTPPQP